MNALRSTGIRIFAVAAIFLAMGGTARTQGPVIRYGAKVPPEVKYIYTRGLAYLAQTQTDAGTWPGRSVSHTGMPGENGVTGLCIMAFLASGEDPNFGKYANNIRKALRSMIRAQDPETGYLPGSMYHHGFAMLALAEAYGVVDDAMLWQGQEKSDRHRTIGQALELAVRCAVTSQKNNKWGGWRYSPSAKDADTSVSGAVLMGLLAARNAGIEVPDTCIEKALGYFRSNTSDKGIVAYTGSISSMGSSMNRSSIATLVYAVGKKKDWDSYRAAQGYITQHLEHQDRWYPFYFRYYMAQALFQADFDAWKKWNRQTIRVLKSMQQDDGSFVGGYHGTSYCTAMSLLALALNHRFLPIYER